jgi:ubiquitin C-terminal hydrolase
MASLLPAVHGGAPILAMSGGGMTDSLLPTIRGPLPDIPGMSGGAVSLLPLGYGDIHGMSGGGVTAASFGITDAFPGDQTEVHAWKEDSTCYPITERVSQVCASLHPFVDRRVQALLKRVSLAPNASINLGCGTIARTGKELKISLHYKAITLLSCDITGTFAAFREGLSPHVPRSVDQTVPDGERGLLSWMLGSDVEEKGEFDLIEFVKDMTKPLPIEGFRQFLSFHTEHGQEDVFRYAMELYGYKTGPLDSGNIEHIYGWIFPPHTAVRRVGEKFAVYSNGMKTVSTWNEAWPPNKKGFTVYEPTSPDTMPTFSKATAAPVAPAPVAPAAVAAAPVAASSAVASPAAVATKAPAPIASVASPVAVAAKSPVTAVTPPKSKSFSGIKNSTPVSIPNQQMFNNKPYTLRGMIQHDGGANGGHYIYLYHSPTKKGEWVRFSDSSMTYPSVDEASKELTTGYIYLFEKEGTDDKKHRGITNNGNSCWMNAALQMFYHIPEYRAYVVEFDADKSTLSPEINDITLILKEIFLKYSTDNVKPVICSTEYKKLFDYTFPDHSEGSQQDAMEFIMKVLLGIVENVPTIRDLFAINETSTLTCSTPSIITSPTHSSTTTLLLTIPSDPTLTLDNLLTYHTTPHKSEDGTKVNGKDCNDPTKTMTFAIPPTNKYMIIGINRFAKV